MEKFAGLLYPHACIICQKSLPGQSKTEIFCSVCRDLFIFNASPSCVRCGRPGRQLNGHNLCPDCLEHPPNFDQAWSAYHYQEPVRRLLFQFKYGQMTLLRHGFENLLVNYIETSRLDLSRFDLIIPMPLSTARFRERGFNQAQFLAESVARRFNLEIELDNLVRIRHTRYQATKTPKERFTNIRGAFTIKHPRRLFGKNILLVDDLLTTGATASEAALMLKMAGANFVGVLTLAVA